MLIVGLECDHVQWLMEVGEDPPTVTPWLLYPLDIGNTIEPGDMMTCVTCDQPRLVKATL